MVERKIKFVFGFQRTFSLRDLRKGIATLTIKADS